MIHSEMTKKKLLEVKKALNTEAMVIIRNFVLCSKLHLLQMYLYYSSLTLQIEQDVDTNEPHDKSSHVEFQKMGTWSKFFFYLKFSFTAYIYLLLLTRICFVDFREQPQRHVHLWCPTLHWIRSHTHENEIWLESEWLNQEWADNFKDKGAWKHSHK